MKKITLFDKSFRTFIPNEQIEEAIDKVADKINADFEAVYRKNAHEYVVRVVDPARSIIIFTAGRNSGLVAGDSTPLIVKRGNVTVGTLRVESINDAEVVAKYTCAPGQRIRVGDNIIHEKPHGS